MHVFGQGGRQEFLNPGDLRGTSNSWVHGQVWVQVMSRASSSFEVDKVAWAWSEVRTSKQIKPKKTANKPLYSIQYLAQKVAGCAMAGWLTVKSLSVLRKAPQSRAGLPLCLRQSTTKTTTTKKTRKWQAKETVLGCFSSDVYWVCSSFKPSMQCFWFPPFLLSKNERQHLFCSLPHTVCCPFLKC